MSECQCRCLLTATHQDTETTILPDPDKLRDYNLCLHSSKAGTSFATIVCRTDCCHPVAPSHHDAHQR